MVSEIARGHIVIAVVKLDESGELGETDQLSA